MSIKISEIFYSFQGEGRYVGVPSIFLCTESLDSERGENSSIDQIADNIVSLLPNPELKDIHLVIMGDEPLIAEYQEEYIKLLEHPLLSQFRHVTIETTGIEPIGTALFEYLDTSRNKEITFSISPKLSASGVSREVAIKPDNIKQYQSLGYSYIKFVVETEDSFTESLEILDIFRKGGFFGYVYIVPDLYCSNKSRVEKFALQNGLRHSNRFALQHSLRIK